MKWLVAASDLPRIQWILQSKIRTVHFGGGFGADPVLSWSNIQFLEAVVLFIKWPLSMFVHTYDKLWLMLYVARCLNYLWVLIVWEVQKYCLLLPFPHLPLAGSIFFSKKMDDTQTHFGPMLCTFWACNDICTRPMVFVYFKEPVSWFQCWVQDWFLAGLRKVLKMVGNGYKVSITSHPYQAGANLRLALP